MHRQRYASDWPSIAAHVKEGAAWRCERCGHPDDPVSHHVLTVHHLDNNPANNAGWNLAALCQRCHLSIQGRLDLRQLFWNEITPMPDWLRPHYYGFLAAS